MATGTSWVQVPIGPQSQWLLSYPTRTADQFTQNAAKKHAKQIRHAKVLKKINKLQLLFFPKYKGLSIKKCQEFLSKLKTDPSRATYNEDHFFFIQSCVGNTEASTYVKQTKKKPTKKPQKPDGFQKIAWLLSIYTAIYTLHQNQISHQDIHVGNIRLDDQDHRAFVIDFDQSQIQSSSGHEITVPPPREPPEGITYEDLNMHQSFDKLKQLDLWRLGLLLLEILLGHSLKHDHLKELQQQQQPLKTILAKLLKETHSNPIIIDLLDKLLNKNPTQRQFLSPLTINSLFTNAKQHYESINKTTSLHLKYLEETYQTHATKSAPKHWFIQIITCIINWLCSVFSSKPTNRDTLPEFTGNLAFASS